MAIDYTAKRATAEKLITNAGEPAQVIKKGITGGYNADGDVVPDTPDTVIDGVVTPIFSYKLSEIDGERIIAGDGYAFFYSDDVPEINSTIEINSIDYRIIDIPSLTSAGGVNVYRKLQLRGG